MRVVPAFARTLWVRQDGQDIIEYALIAGFVAIIAAASLPPATAAVSHLFGLVMSGLDLVTSSITAS